MVLKLIIQTVSTVIFCNGAYMQKSLCERETRDAIKVRARCCVRSYIRERPIAGDSSACKRGREVACICKRVRDRQGVLFPVDEHTSGCNSRVTQTRMMCVTWASDKSLININKNLVNWISILILHFYFLNRILNSYNLFEKLQL